MVYSSIACTDPGILVRGIQAQLTEQSFDNIFFSYFKEGVQWYFFKESYNFPRFPGWVQHFSGVGVQLLLVGSNCSFLLKPIELVIFQGGVEPPVPPLDMHIY